MEEESVSSFLFLFLSHSCRDSSRNIVFDNVYQHVPYKYEIKINDNS